MSIYINILGRKKFLINAIASEKIDKLKEDIQEKENIPIQEQNLFFCDQELSDYSLNHYNIENDDIILCIIFDKYINVKSGDKLYKIRYNESYTISELKNEIHQKISFMQTAFQLKYNINIKI